MTEVKRDDSRTHAERMKATLELVLNQSIHGTTPIQSDCLGNFEYNMKAAIAELNEYIADRLKMYR